jgi:hypothetical protein
MTERNSFGRIPPAPPVFAENGTNPNARSYADGIGKTNATPNTLLPDGRHKYATDGVTTDWWDTHVRPQEESDGN